MIIFSNFFVTYLIRYTNIYNRAIAQEQCAYFRHTGVQVDLQYKVWKFREVCLIFIAFIHIYPEQLYIFEFSKDNSFLLLTMCDQIPP